MSGEGEARAARVAGLRNEVKIKRMQASRVNDQMLNLGVLRKYMAQAIESGSYDKADEWLKENYKDNPDTAVDEGIPPQAMHALVEKIFGEGGNVTPQEAADKLGNINGEFRQLYAMRTRMYQMAEGIRRQIDNISAAGIEEANAKSG